MLKAVFLDIDGTLLPRSLEQWFVPFLVWRGYRRPASMASEYSRRLLSGAATSWFDLKLLYLSGVPLATVEEWAEECWEAVIRRRLFRGMSVVVQRLRERSVRLVLLSGSPMFLAERVGRHFGVNELICAEPEMVDGLLTGALVRPHPRGIRKRQEAERWLVAHKLAASEAGAIGDHWDDRFLLALVGAPLVVQPGRRLRVMARRQAWPVVERPDDVQETNGVLEAYLRATSAQARGDSR